MAVLPATRIEGGLLGPDVLDQLLAGDLPGQKPADFGLEARRNLTDEIAAAFVDARAMWGVFQHRLQRLPESDLATTVTRDAWVIPFLGLLGFEARFNPRAHEVDSLSFAISHRAGEAEDAPPVHIVGARQELGRVPASGRPRLAPHSLVQEYLNRTEHLWGLVTNGLTLRLLRNSSFVRRQAYVEFDLTAIFDEQRFQDFAALYRLLHRTRLPRGLADANQCLLEQYYARSIEQGGRVREHLREGVEECIERLANGFLRHRANDELRRRATPDCSDNDRILPVDFYRQLLRLIYRFLFLLVSEDRGLLSSDPVYHEHYGIGRMRRLLESRSAYTDDDDLWQGLRVLWRVLCDERLAALLRVAPLNGELFAPQALDGFTLSNRSLLEAFWRLAWYRDKEAAPPRRVNYAALDVEELGSVYESLLEFHPTVASESSGHLSFALVLGSERKTTGSYYTSPELVNEIVRSALEPVVREGVRGSAVEREKALLTIRVCDPACGSGHFLLAAARSMGKELARIRSGEDEPAPERVREAIRDVMSHCIYGVDHNPLAVDLCRVALWLESHAEGKPLTFLDHRIRCGDSLAGVLSDEMIGQGIPDEAFEPLERDDAAFAKALARRNRQERAGQRNLFVAEPASAGYDVTAWTRELDAIADDSPEGIRRKKQLYESSHTEQSWLRQRETYDLWVGAFFQPLKNDSPAITTVSFFDHLAGRPIDGQVMAWAWTLSERHRFFHWKIEFPDVFATGGFDVVIGNPPWELVKRESGEAGESSHDDSKRWYRSGRYRILSGRRDLYKLFLVLGAALLSARGRLGFVVPFGAFVEEDCRELRRHLYMDAGGIASLMHLQNAGKKFFADVHASYRFACMTFSKNKEIGHRFSVVVSAPDGVAQPKWIDVPKSRLEEELSDSLGAVLYPDTAYFQVHQKLLAKIRALTQQDYEVVAEFHATSHKRLLSREPASERDWRLLKNRSIHQFNHHFGDADQYLAEDVVRKRCIEKGLDPNVWLRSRRLLFRDIARNDDARTLICCLAPPGYVSSYDTPMIVPVIRDELLNVTLAYLCGLLNSFVFDFLIRPFVDKHVKPYVLRRLPIPAFDPSNRTIVKIAECAERVTQATEQNTDNGAGGLEVLRARAELNATVARCFEVSSNEMQVVLDSFPIVKNEEEKAQGRFVSRDLVIESLA